MNRRQSRVRHHYAVVPKLLIAAVLGLMLSACTTPRAVTGSATTQKLAQQQNWTLKGRVSIRSDQGSFIAYIRWQQHGPNSTLRIYGTLGQTYAALHVGETVSELQLKGKTYHDSNPQRLMFNTLGWMLPFRPLRQWVKGVIPQGHNNVTVNRNDQGQPTQLNYRQWKIQYLRYRRFKSFAGLYLPSKLQLTYPNLKIRISIQSWQLDQP